MPLAPKLIFKYLAGALFLLVGVAMLLAYFGTEIISFTTTGYELALLGALNLVIGVGLFLNYKFAYYFAVFSAVLTLISALTGEFLSLIIALVILLVVVLSADVKLFTEKLTARFRGSSNYRFYRKV